MNGLLDEGTQALLDLLPALGAVFVGCVLFFWLLALLGCYILGKGKKTE